MLQRSNVDTLGWTSRLAQARHHFAFDSRYPAHAPARNLWSGTTTRSRRTALPSNGHRDMEIVTMCARAYSNTKTVRGCGEFAGNVQGSPRPWNLHSEYNDNDGP